LNLRYKLFAPQRGDTQRNMSRPVGAVFVGDGIRYKYVAPLGNHQRLSELNARARGIAAEPPAKPRSGDAGDGADSPTTREARRLAQIFIIFLERKREREYQIAPLLGQIQNAVAAKMLQIRRIE